MSLWLGWLVGRYVRVTDGVVVGESGGWGWDTKCSLPIVLSPKQGSFTLDPVLCNKPNNSNPSNNINAYNSNATPMTATLST